MEPDWSQYEGHLALSEEDNEPELDFDWDDANMAHIGAHAVKPEEAVEVFFNDSIDYPEYVEEDEVRYDKLGRTDNDRVLLVVYTLRGDKIRVVTAFRPSDEDIVQFRRRFPHEPE